MLYGGAIAGVRGLSLTVPDGGFVALLGANGAGKTTTLKTISGLLPFENGRVVAGTIRFFGEDIAGVHAHQLARRGLLHVREGRHVFANMTLEENLAAATFALTGRGRRAGGFDDIYAYFPLLAARRKSYAGLLSGGEQQMLAIGRALVGDPRLLLVDEASLGLAPMIAQGNLRHSRPHQCREEARDPGGGAERVAGAETRRVTATSWRTAPWCWKARPAELCGPRTGLQPLSRRRLAAAAPAV